MVMFSQNGTTEKLDSMTTDAMAPADTYRIEKLKQSAMTHCPINKTRSDTPECLAKPLLSGNHAPHCTDAEKKNSRGA